MKNSEEQDGAKPYEVDLIETVKWLEAKGKEQFGKHFHFNKNDYDIIFKLLVYLHRDKINGELLGMDFRKGIMLSGPIGCGKTCLMSLVRHLKYPGYSYQVTPAREICIQFMDQGYSVVKHYSSMGYKQPQVFCFDDLGSEPATKYYGNDANVMGEILLSRYDLLVQRGIPTHATTNLSASELERLYGNRVRSRLREMFNLIAFPNDAPDKRR